MMRRWVFSAATMAVIAFFAGPVPAAMAQKDVPIPEGSRACVDCHRKEKVAATAIEEWGHSTHAKEGVGCVDCHAAKKEDRDAFDH